MDATLQPSRATLQQTEGPHSLLSRLGERIAKRMGVLYVARLALHRDALRVELQTVPVRIQKLANQSRLALELVDDIRSGKYRAKVTTLAIAAGALLYAVSPGDVIPDVFAGLGQLDDALIIAVAMRTIRKDLERYVVFKGYTREDYF